MRAGDSNLTCQCKWLKFTKEFKKAKEVNDGPSSVICWPLPVWFIDVFVGYFQCQILIHKTYFYVRGTCFIALQWNYLVAEEQDI